MLQHMENLHRSLRDMWVGIVMQHQDTTSVNRCWMLADKFVVHFVELRTITICSDGFSSPEKDNMMDHSHHKPPYQQHLP